ncbi:MAG: HEAT repeat domain-containing protein [Ginsengibacter sp.]
MQALNLTFLQIDTIVFIRAIYIFLVILSALFGIILGFTIYKRRIEKNKKAWHQSLAGIISQAIVLTEEETINITDEIKKLLKKSIFRRYVIDELIHALKNLSGASTLNLVHLYEILELNIDSFKKLHSKRWHIKAKGIQELGIMNQKKYSREIFRLTNHPNELVRNEAQCSIISLYGFSGLRFLNVAAYPISKLQQIELLNKLKGLKPKNSEGFKKWLQSSNESVVIFSLKLATSVNLHNLYDNVVNCLQSNCLEIKLNALEYIKKIPGENSAGIIVSHYFFNNKIFRLAIIDALRDIGSENEISFLLSLLHDEDDEIKAAGAKSLSWLHPLGADFLQAHSFADQDPWKNIFLEIKNERAA